MNKEEALKLISEKDTADWHVVPKEEHETFLTNFRETEVNKEIGKHVFEVHQKYDDTIVEVLGEPKPRDVKTHEFLKTKLSAMKEDIQSREARISDLEKAVNDKSGDEALKLAQSNYDALQKKYQKTLDEFKSKDDQRVKELNHVKLMNEADHALMGIKFLSTVPEDARNALVEIAKNEVAKDAAFLDNKVVFLDANGDPVRDDQYNVVTMEARLKEKLKSIIDEGRKQSGVSIKDPTIEKDENGKVKVTLAIPDNVSTMEGLINHIQESGIKRGTDEYFAALKYGVDKLNLET